MSRLKYLGTYPLEVPDLARVLQPGEEFEVADPELAERLKAKEHIFVEATVSRRRVASPEP